MDTKIKYEEISTKIEKNKGLVMQEVDSYIEKGIQQWN